MVHEMLLKKRALAGALVVVLVAQLAAVLVSMFTSFSRGASDDYVWVGGVQSTSATFRLRAPKGSDREFVVTTEQNLEGGVVWRNSSLNFATDFAVQRVDVSGLTPETQYYFGQYQDGSLRSSGSFRTPAAEGTPFSFRVATGGCQLTASRNSVFARIKEKEPLLFLHAGDFHYMDLDEEAVDERVDAFDRVFSSDTASDLYSNVAFAYMWDDHDMCANNQNSECEKVTEARKAYQKIIPHYELPAASLPSAPAADAQGLLDISPYQAFTIGTVRFIISDLRSEAKKSTADFPGSIYSQEQRDFLFAEIENAASYDFVVWITSKPWIGEEDVGGDNWQGFAKDRQELSDHIATHVGGGKQNLLAISSDAHMLAFDDGRNTGYNINKTFPAGFPILQSGPLHNIGSVKGGPFSDSCYTYIGEMNNQYSIIDFEIEAGKDPLIKFTSYAMKGPGSEQEEVIYSKTLGPLLFAPADAQQGGDCTGSLVRTQTIGVGLAAFALLFLGGAVFLFIFEDKKFVAKVLGIALLASFIAFLIGGAMPFATFATNNHFQVNTFSISVTCLLVVIFSLSFLGLHDRAKSTESTVSVEMSKA